MLKLEITNQSFDFLKILPLKHFKQVTLAYLGLAKTPRPTDSQILKGYPEFWRKDIGEYRIIYRWEAATVYIELIGKRHDDPVYK